MCFLSASCLYKKRLACLFFCSLFSGSIAYFYFPLLYYAYNFGNIFSNLRPLGRNPKTEKARKLLRNFGQKRGRSIFSICWVAGLIQLCSKWKLLITSGKRNCFEHLSFMTVTNRLDTICSLNTQIYKQDRDHPCKHIYYDTAVFSGSFSFGP